MLFDLFPTVIFCKKLENISLQTLSNYKKFLSSCEYVDNNLNNSKEGKISTNQNILDLPLFSDLKDSILKYTINYFKNIGYLHKDYKITCSWSNILGKNEYIASHNHSNSQLSGCFYLEDSLSKITFKNPLFNKWMIEIGNHQHNNQNHRSWNSYSISPKSNSLLLFPSWLEHLVNPSIENNRLSVAFNIIPCGQLGWETNQLNI